MFWIENNSFKKFKAPADEESRKNAPAACPESGLPDPIMGPASELMEYPAGRRLLAGRHIPPPTPPTTPINSAGSPCSTVLTVLEPVPISEPDLERGATVDLDGVVPGDRFAVDARLVRVQRPTSRVTGRHGRYLAVGVLGALVISAVINFGVSYVQYAQQAPSAVSPDLFRPPMSLVADAGFTAAAQSVLTWVITLPLVNRDILGGRVAPLRLRFWGRQPQGQFRRWFLMLDHYNAHQGSWWCACQQATGCGTRLSFFLGQIVRGLLIGVLGYSILIGPGIATLMAIGTPVGNDYVFPNRWAVIIFKTVWAALLALITVPPLVVMVLVRAGWCVMD